jgi:hypothetical protein
MLLLSSHSVYRTRKIYVKYEYEEAPARLKGITQLRVLYKSPEKGRALCDFPGTYATSQGHTV